MLSMKIREMVDFKEMVDGVYETCMATVEENKDDHITRMGCEAVVNEWYEGKMNLFDLFGGKLKLEKTVVSDATRVEYSDILENYGYALRGGVITYNRKEMQLQVACARKIASHPLIGGTFNLFYTVSGLINYCANSDNGFPELQQNKIGEALERYIYGEFNEYKNLQYKSMNNIKGKKVSKFMRSIMLEYVEKLHLNNQLSQEEYQVAIKEVDILSQYLSAMFEKIKPMKTEKTVVLSIDPRDYFRCSHGETWNSCHALGNMHGDGAVEYCISPYAMIAYVESEKHCRGVHQLKWRQMIYTNKNHNTFVGSRQYRAVDKSTMLALMELLEELATEKYGYTFEKFTKATYNDVDTFQDYVKNFVNRSAEDDYVCFAYNDIHQYSGISEDLFLMYTDVDNEKVSVNPRKYIPCLECGEMFSGHRDNLFTCENCEPEGDWCEHCEAYHENVEWCDDLNMYICEYCLHESGTFTWCEYCQEWHYTENCREVGYNTCEYVCQDCLDYNFTYCEECECYEPCEKVGCYEDENGWEHYVCDDCKNSVIDTCENCGTEFYNTHEYYTISCSEDCHCELTDIEDEDEE